MSTLSIHLTDLCNSKCSFCVVGSPLYVKDTIDYAEVEAFLIANSDQGFSSVNLHGGEATIHPKFVQVLELIRALGYPEVHLQTNGIRLSDPGYAELLWSLGVRLFIVSLHGDVAEVHDGQTGSPGGFLQTIKGIKNVKGLGARVRTNTVVTVQNVRRLPEICDICNGLGVDHINISNLHPVGSALFGFTRLVPTFETIREFLYPAIENCLTKNVVVTLEGFPYCTVKQYSHLHLNENGRGVKMLMRGRIIEDYDDFMSTTCRVFGSECSECVARAKCGGVYPEYVQYRGWSEIARF